MYLAALDNNGVAAGSPFQSGGASLGGALSTSQISGGGATGLYSCVSAYLTVVHGSC